MIEREFIAQKTKEYNIKKYIESKFTGAGISHVKLKKIPLGEKIVIYTSRPSLIVGSRGVNIRDLTRTLKEQFKLENPQIEISEIRDPFLDPAIVAEKITGSLERFGSARFKGVGHKMMESVIGAGALGVEIIISGKIPGARAKSWRFYQGYLKKCGDIALSQVLIGKRTALLKSGIIGVKVSIMPPGVILPDHIDILSEQEQAAAQVVSEAAQVSAEEAAAVKKKAAPKKKSGSPAAKKKIAKKKEIVSEPETSEEKSDSPSTDSELK